MSKEHDEFVQAYKEGKIDTGINLSGGKWTICGVFGGKLSYMDLPVVAEKEEECWGCGNLISQCECGDEPYPGDEECNCDGCSGCEFNDDELDEEEF